MIAALLCGLFYGAFFLSVHNKAERRRWLDRGLERLLRDVYGREESRGCGKDGTEFDLYAMTHTGYEDG